LELLSVPLLAVMPVLELVPPVLVPLALPLVFLPSTPPSRLADIPAG
jgi:hypothetical protein